MAEDDNIGLREPSAQARTSTGSRAAVVDGRHFASFEVDDESLGQDEAAVVVAEHRPNGCEVLQRRQDRRVGDIARVDDDVGRLEVPAQPFHQPSSLALA